jgi:NTP pyrophosphatase (non-canonical NTP hydrolase)
VTERDDHGQDRMVTITETHFHQLQQDAAERGADRALAKLGLENGEAREDINDLRGLLRMLKQMRNQLGEQVWRFLILSALIGLAALIGIKAKVLG